MSEALRSNSGQAIDEQLLVIHDKEVNLTSSDNPRQIINDYKRVGMGLSPDDLETADLIAKRIQKLELADDPKEYNPASGAH